MYVEAGIPLIGQFSTIVTENQTLTIIQDICGFHTNQTDSLIDVIDTIQYQLCDVATILEDIRQFMQCSNWYPLYETTVYETVCYDGTKGFAYVATTQFIIVLCSFLILTFRVAFWDIQIGDIYYNFIDENENENKNKTENQNENENETEKKDDHDNNNNNNSNNNEDGGFEVGYYKGIRDRVTSSSKNCKQVGPVSSSEEQQQQPPTSLFNLLRFQSSFFDFDDSNATAMTSAPTSSFEEPVATAAAAATSATADNDHRRNSRYPSRRRNHRHRDDNPLQPQSQTRIATTTTARSDGGNNNEDGSGDGDDDGDGIELEHYYSYKNNEPSSAAGATTAGVATDAWSVWAKQQKQNSNSDSDSDDDFNVNGLVDLDDDDDWKGEI